MGLSNKISFLRGIKMKWKLCEVRHEIYKKDIYWLPTIRTIINELQYVQKNLSIEFHFLMFHARLQFIVKKYDNE